MCAIAGVVNWGDRETVACMANAQRHRGPDDGDVCFFPSERVGLGHRRLSIIDLSTAGRQPMANEDGTVWIVFNGEIYNFQELRKNLETAHRFCSSTDSEVVLHLYEEVGSNFVRYLNGMFAFAILDRTRRKLVLARDHFGIKPLYYCQANGHFAFASEIKAILASGMCSPDINWQGLYDYFTYLYVPCPETIFKGIFQVPPAHVLELDLDSNDLRFRRYWQLEQAGIEADQVKRDHEDDKDRLRALLADSVRRQMVSDVPLGVFLSGGVDSPILTGLMAKTSPRPVKTFTVIFHGKNLEFYDERDNARAVADKFATEHHEVEVEIGDPMAMLRLVEYFDQPFGNPTFYLMHLISRHTRSEVTVALCGAGGDELFGGYPRYQAMALARWLKWVPPVMLNGVRQILGLPSDDYRSMSLRRIRQFLDGLDADFARQFVKWTYFLDESQKRLLLEPTVAAKRGQSNGFFPSDRIVRMYLENSPLKDFGNRVLHLDVQTFLPDNLLEYTDKMSMAVGLEVRVPYLDYRVVEHSFTIPFHDKLRGTRSKVVLKEAFADLLPEANRNAPKRGFNVPLALWMRDHLDQYFDLYMGRREVEREGILNWEYIQLLRHQHRTRKRDNSYELFSIIMFDVWYRKYILGLDLSAPSLHR